MIKNQIWVIDDDLSILEVVQIILEEEGYQVSLMDNFPLLKKRLQKSKPHLFLIDILMKGTDGCDVVKYLKKKEQTKKIPVIMVSADHKAEEKAKKAGAENLLKKPFNIDDLLRIVKKYI